MDTQILAFVALLALMWLGFWLMFGKPGNKRPSGNDPNDGGYWGGPRF